MRLEIKVRCHCGRANSDGHSIIVCDHCGFGQHWICTSLASETPSLLWLCFLCKPRILESEVIETPSVVESSAANSAPLNTWTGAPNGGGPETVQLDSHEPYDISGGYSDFFLGTCSVRGRVGLKRLRVPNNRNTENEIRRFRKEAETWKELRHEHVLPFWGLITIERYYYLVSPFMEDGKLTDYFLKEPLANRGRAIRQAASALKYLHGEGIIHGDIKGSNILASPTGDALICDFGLAKAFGTQTSTSRKGSGTLRWSSPEIVNGHPKSFESDIWAFGMTIYELLSGNIPYFDRTSDASIVLAVIQGVLPPHEPASSPNNVSYAALWVLAEDCWAPLSVRTTSDQLYEELIELYREPENVETLRISGETIQPVQEFIRDMKRVCAPYIQEEGGGGFRCKLCSNLFRTSYITGKHIISRHRLGVDNVTS